MVKSVLIEHEACLSVTCFVFKSLVLCKNWHSFFKFVGIFQVSSKHIIVKCTHPVTYGRDWDWNERKRESAAHHRHPITQELPRKSLSVLRNQNLKCNSTPHSSAIPLHTHHSLTKWVQMKMYSGPLTGLTIGSADTELWETLKEKQQLTEIAGPEVKRTDKVCIFSSQRWGYIYCRKV